MGGGTLWTLSTNAAASKALINTFVKHYTVPMKGLNFLFPVIDNIKYVQSLKEVAIDIPSQSAITEGMKSSVDDVII